MKLPTSYPFLSLSRIRNVRYGDVLSYADLCSRPTFAEPTCWQIEAAERLDGPTKKMIFDAVMKDIPLEVPRIAN